MKKLKIDSIFNNKKYLRIFSLLLAIIAWFFVIFVVSPEKTKTISGLSVRLSSNYITAEKLELQAIEGLDQKIDVVIVGNRSVVDTVTQSDIAVYASLDDVTERGTYTLTLRGENTTNKNFNIISLSPTNIDVKFDRVVSKTLTVDVDISGLEIEKGFVAENYTVSPSEIVVTGPEKEIESIEKCSVKIETDSKVNSTVSFKNQKIRIFDSNGYEIDSRYVIIDKSDANVVVPVLKIKSLPVEIRFTNVPSYFSLDSLSYSLSNEEILIAGPSSIVDNYNSIQLGEISLASLKPTDTYSFDVNLPAGFVNMENVETVTVTFDMDSYTSKEISVTDFRVTDIPENYNISVITKSINGIKVYGPREVVNLLSAQDVIAEVKIRGNNIVVGQCRIPVSLYIPLNQSIWTYGDYSVIIEVKEQE